MIRRIEIIVNRLAVLLGGGMLLAARSGLRKKALVEKQRLAYCLVNCREWIQCKKKLKTRFRLAGGFFAAAIGDGKSMVVSRALQGDISMNPSILCMKSLLDGGFIKGMSSMGIGVLFYVIPRGIYQDGMTTGFAVLIEPYVTGGLFFWISIINFVVLLEIGLNCSGKSVETGNLSVSLLMLVYGRLMKKRERRLHVGGESGATIDSFE